MVKKEIIIKDTHRGLYYQDGVLTKVLPAGRYEVLEQHKSKILNYLFPRPKVEIILVSVQERDLTIKGQEILTSDKVAIRVSIIVQFRVTNPQAAIHMVTNYEERIYSDVQLAARRSLASMTLEEILTNRNHLSEEILHEVKESASGYGVAILRADVKDLIFPGNLQEIMNKVLAAERMSQAQMVEARTKAEVQKIDAQTRATNQQLEAETAANAKLLVAQAEAEALKIKTEADVKALQDREQAAQAYSTYPALLRLRELETLSDLSKTANARIYIGFDKHLAKNDELEK
ncbi:MAG: slipin family protein [Acidobacteria bacterium]|jgi:regulator of protease activity HflC (stomatin/prohibitin superfamily)|nr:slipin family protein [Acidobacteriota bacterium]